jgi:hypothetical protein
MMDSSKRQDGIGGSRLFYLWRSSFLAVDRIAKWLQCMDLFRAVDNLIADMFKEDSSDFLNGEGVSLAGVA